MFLYQKMQHPNIQCLSLPFNNVNYCTAAESILNIKRFISTLYVLRSIAMNNSAMVCESMVWKGETLVGSVRGQGQRCAHQSYSDNGSTGERWLLLRRRKSQGSPFSRWGCVSRAEAIRPALILHLLSYINIPSARNKAAPKPWRARTYRRKKNPDVARKKQKKLSQLFFLLIALQHSLFLVLHLHLLPFRFYPSTLSSSTLFFTFQKNWAMGILYLHRTSMHILQTNCAD